MHLHGYSAHAVYPQSGGVGPFGACVLSPWHLCPRPPDAPALVARPSWQVRDAATGAIVQQLGSGAAAAAAGAGGGAAAGGGGGGGLGSGSVSAAAKRAAEEGLLMDGFEPPQVRLCA